MECKQTMGTPKGVIATQDAIKKSGTEMTKGAGNDSATPGRTPHGLNGSMKK